MNQILNDLYLGDHVGSESKDVLTRCGVTHIVNITDNLPCKFPSSFEYLQVKVLDCEQTNLKSFFPVIFKFID